MPVTFGHDGLIIPKSLTADALMQMNQMSFFSKASNGGFGEGAFEYGTTVQFRRVQILEAEDFDPRGADPARTDDPGYVLGDIVLNHLLTTGVQRYSSDYRGDKYVEEVSPQLAFALTKKFDNALYTQFRTPTHASSGAVQYGVGMPLRIVANDTNGTLTHFTQDLLINAGASLEEEDVPPGDLYAALATRAKSAYIGEQTPVDAGYVYGQIGVSELVQRNLPNGQLVPRQGFMVGGTNVIGRNGSQAPVLDLDTASNNQASLAIASVAVNTQFTKADIYVIDGGSATLLGAIDLTLTATALQGVAVGQIARLGADNGTTKAYGIVLRVAGLVVSLVPFAPDGTQLTTTDISTTSDKFSIPKINSVNVGYKSNALVFDTRQMEAPPDMSGARMAGAQDENSGLLLQYWEGGYDVNRFKSYSRATLMFGTKFTDYRCGCFMLSA